MADGLDWLRQLLIGIQLDSFLHTIQHDLHINRPCDFDAICEEDLVRIGVSRLAAKRLLTAAADCRPHCQSNTAAVNHSPMSVGGACGGKPATAAYVPGGSRSSAAEFQPDAACLPGLQCCVSNSGLAIDRLLGVGSLGNVHRAEQTQPHSMQKMLLAVRVLASGLMPPPSLTDSHSSANKSPTDIIAELNAMSELRHGNVLQMFGVVMTTATPMLLFEFAELGSLKACLLQSLPSDSSSRYVVTMTTLLGYMVQAAHGLVYLENQGFIHGNLAACNIMLTSSQQVKIGDYGLTRLLPGARNNSRTKRDAWYAPETLEKAMFTHASDSWMFGVVLWEVFSGGVDPVWFGVPAAQILKRLRGGERLPRPAHCPDKVYQLMSRCWYNSPLERLQFVAIVELLNEVAMPEKMALWDLEEPGKLTAKNGDMIIILKGTLDDALWEGQNKRTGSKGFFPPDLVLCSTAAPTKNSPAKIGENVSNAGRNDTTTDGALIAFNDQPAKMCANSVAVGLKSTVKPAALPGWTTFESVTNLTEAAATGGRSGDSNQMPIPTITKESKPLLLSRVQGDSHKHSATNGVPAMVMEKPMLKGKTSAREKYSETGSDVDIDVSDRTCLIPGSSSTSVSEPCSPAHGSSARGGPDLLAIDNVCYDEGVDGDPNGLCHSLPATKFPERLSWMTSASCENLNVGASQRSHGGGNGLCAPSYFGEHLSKASSDSPVYVGADLAAAARGGAPPVPPVPPRDYPPGGSSAIRRHGTIPGGRSTSMKRSEIHPILQDGQRRSSTHYWLLPEKQRFELLVPTSHTADVMPYVNVPEGERVCKRPAVASDATHFDSSPSTVTCLPEFLETNENLTSMGEVSEKIQRVRALLGADVSPEESYTALAAHQWCVDDAVQYLKIEHLFRLGIASRAVCRAALHAHRWDLEPAASALLDRSETAPKRNS